MQIFRLHLLLAGAIVHKWAIPFHKPVRVEGPVRPSISKAEPLDAPISPKLVAHPFAAAAEPRPARGLLPSPSLFHLRHRRHRVFVVCQYDVINSLLIRSAHSSRTLHLLRLQLSQLNMLILFPILSTIHTIGSRRCSLLILRASPPCPVATDILVTLVNRLRRLALRLQSKINIQ
jgi:hypothetical protein